MPIYEYRCSGCGFQKEYLQKVSEAPMSVCPSCSRATFNKMLTAAGFHLKGSGWYATDFKSRAKAEPADAKPGVDAANGAKAEGKAEAKSETRSETKPEAKSETKTESKSEATKESGSKAAAPAVT